MSIKDTLERVLDSTQHIFHNDESDDGKPPQEAPVDAIELLKRDHREVEALFKEVLEDDSDALTAQRKKIERIVQMLELHAKVEEALFYPAIQQKTKRNTEDRHGVLEAFEEHGSMKDLMRKIKRATGRDESLRAKVQVLSEITEHHVKEEESSLFGEARRLLGEKKLLAIGAEIAKIKARAERRDAPKTTRARAGAKRSPVARKKTTSKAGRAKK
ncbi:MAG: hemerythrin domain-containing protein [Candidatus Eremiobacteraeota bacterium]|nr:hemerythrin domain-containing protein [Candidatus Eremiobacteraeota bacterium]